MLNQFPNTKLIIGSRRTGSIGELAVPGDHQIPAVPRSPTPSTRTDDHYLTYNQPGRQKKPTNESFPTPSSPPRALENSPHTMTPTTQAAAAATPQAAKLASIGEAKVGVKVEVGHHTVAKRAKGGSICVSGRLCIGLGRGGLSSSSVGSGGSRCRLLPWRSRGGRRNWRCGG